MQRKWIGAAALVLALAVVLGAFGAHALKARLSPEALGQWHTGVEYQFYHGFGILLIVALAGHLPERSSKHIMRLFLVGILLFSGSLYLLSTRELTGLDHIGSWVGPLTPLGGAAFIVGWLMLLITAWRGRSAA